MGDRYRKQKYDNDRESERMVHLMEDSYRDDKSKSNTPKAFVKGGTIDPTSKVTKSDTRGDLYIPSNKDKDSRRTENVYDRHQSQSSFSSQSYAPPLAQKVRNIDKVAQEMKAKRQMETSNKVKQPERPQQTRETNREPIKYKGSNFSDTIPQKKEAEKEKDFMESTEETNTLFSNLSNYHTYIFAEQSAASLVLVNLPYSIQESELRSILGGYGTVASLTLCGLKPTQDQPPRLVAFVKYSKEEEAQAAKDALKKEKIRGVIVTVRWGQMPANSKSIKDEPEAFENMLYVRVPTSNFTRKVIDKVSKYVASDGYVIEQVLIEREGDNPEFSFLHTKGSDDHNYYRWRVYAYANGDTDRDWRLEPFRMYDHGPLWHPPLNIESSEKEKKKQATGSIRLNDEEREQFEDILRNLTTERRSINDAMAYCLDNADHSTEIVFILTESFESIETPMTKHIARLYLINDILYNSSLLNVPAAWSYRKFFEAKLPQIFESLNKARHLIKDQVSSETAKDKISKVIRIWNDRATYDLKFFSGLEAAFSKRSNHFGTPQATQKSSDGNEKTNFMKDNSDIGLNLRLIEEKLNDVSTKDLEKTCRSNGLSLVGKRSDLIERILVLRDFELRNNRGDKTDLGIQFDTVERKKIDITPDFIKNYNKLLSVKQSQNLGLHEIDQMISGGFELLKFIQTRNEKISEKNLDGEILDELDIALYGLPGTDDLDIENLDEKDIPSGIDLDGEPLTDAELRELARLDKKQGSSENNSSNKYNNQRSPKDRRERERSRGRDRSRDRNKGKKYSKRRSSSSSRSSSRSASSKSNSRSRSDSRSRSRSSSGKKSKRTQKRR